MEAIAAFGLVGLGYLVNRLSQTNENFQNEPVSPLQTNQQGNSVKSSNQELGLHYATPFGQTYPSEPNPGPKGSAFAYGGVKPNNESSLPGSTLPRQQTIDTTSPQVTMNANNIEETPSYLEEGFTMSALSGQAISSSEFTHNNMVPFFGARVTQNMAGTGVVSGNYIDGVTVDSGFDQDPSNQRLRFVHRDSR
jgi:hypothetical protein